MARKEAEDEFANFCHRHGVWAHKWRDVSYCPNCRQPIFPKKSKKGEDYTKTIVDYLIFTGPINPWVPHWVEVKGTFTSHRHSLNELTERQIAFMNDWTEKGVLTWLWLAMGDTGRAPGGRQSYLIPWEKYYPAHLQAERVLMKSIPWKPTNRQKDLFSVEERFGEFALEWTANQGWTMPHWRTHLFSIYLESDE